ncbi:MAG: hypothetical protein UIG59_04800, partial [Acutalibacteraceae bacterium]|nr:hypothetical protein [Acutalibacteraceae bacterium]
VYVNKVYSEGEITRTNFADTDADYNAKAAVTSGTELALYEDVYAGLFPVIGKGAALVAIGMEDSYISIRDSAAPITIVKDGSTRDMSLIGSVGLVGVVANSGSGKAIIDQCYINSSVELSGGRTAMIGCGNKTTEFIVSNCYAIATINVFKGTSGTNWDNNTGNRFMLLSGYDSNPTVYSCYSWGNISNNGNFTKNISPANNVYYFDGWANSSYATKVTENAIKGSGAKELMINLDWTKFETKADSRPVLKVFSTHNLGTEGAVWDGTPVQPTEDLDKNGYVEINNASQLNWVVSKGNGNYELTRDIWLNDIAVYGAGGFFLADRAPKVWDSKETFNGNFNGNGHIVHGIFYNTKPVDKATSNKNDIRSGLFANLASNANVTKLGIKDSFIMNHAAYSMGAISGAYKGNGAVIDQCFVDESVYLLGWSGVGGFIGEGNTTVTIKNSYSLAYVNAAGDSKAAGFIGDTWFDDRVTIINSFTNNSKVQGQKRTLKSATGLYAVSNDNGATPVTALNMMGTAAFTNMPNLNANGAFQATARYPMLRIFDPDYVEEEVVGEVWNGSIAATYAGGTGTAEEPYIISKGSQLAKAINSFGENGAYFKLDRDIYLNDVTKKNWTEGANYWFTGIAGTDANGYTYNSYKSKVSEVTKTGNVGIFSGNIDGNGFHVYGVCYPSDTASYASSLIPAVAGGTFKNLGLDHFYLNATDTAAAFAAFTCKYSAPIVIDNCYIGEDIKLAVDDAKGAKGGFIGYANGKNGSNSITIKNSYVLIPAANLGGYGTKSCAFISETWLTSYYMSNCYSVAQPINPGGAKERASTAYADDLSKISSVLSNVFCLENAGIEFGNYEKYDDGNGNVTKAFTTLASSEMRGTKVFDKMTINGEGAFLYNIGYPSLVLFGNTVPTEEELLEGLTNVGTMNENAGTFTVPTSALVYSTTVTAGALEELNIGGKYFFQITETGAMVLAGEETVNKQLTLSGTVNVKIYVVGGFMIAFVNDECVGLVSVSVAPNTSFTKAGANASAIDLYIADATFDGVTFGDVNLQLKDNLGNATTGGVKLDVNLTESDAINDFGYETEYGVLLVIGDKVVSDITADGAVKYVMNGAAQNFEITGLGTAKQELFFALRGYAKIKVTDEIDYYYYGSTTTVFSPIYEANDLYANENYADAIKAVYGASDKFIENYDGDIEFATFGDYHYKTGMYTSILSDMKAVVDTAKTLNDGQGADFILSLGDMTNDMKGSKEVTNYLLDGKYSFRGTESPRIII